MPKDTPTPNSEQDELAAKHDKARNSLQAARDAVKIARESIQPVPGDEFIGTALSALAQCDTILELGSR